MIDTLHIVETPEGVELELPVAGPVTRLLAWAIDCAIQAAILVLLASVFLVAAASIDPGAWGLLMIAGFVELWFYGVLFEVYNRGRTPGKTMLGIQVVCDDGTPVGWGPSILRNFLLSADWLPFGYLLGFLSMSIDSSFRRLGDLAAGTLVIYSPQPLVRPRIATAAPKPPPVELELDERRAVIAFAARAHLLSTSRANELASAAAPLLDPSAPTEPHRRVLQIAAWLIGRSESSPAHEAAERPAEERATSATPSGSSLGFGARR